MSRLKDLEQDISFQQSLFSAPRNRSRTWARAKDLTNPTLVPPDLVLERMIEHGASVRDLFNLADSMTNPQVRQAFINRVFGFYEREKTTFLRDAIHNVQHFLAHPLPAGYGSISQAILTVQVPWITADVQYIRNTFPQLIPRLAPLEALLTNARTLL